MTTVTRAETRQELAPYHVNRFFRRAFVHRRGGEAAFQDTGHYQEVKLTHLKAVGQGSA